MRSRILSTQGAYFVLPITCLLLDLPFSSAQPTRGDNVAITGSERRIEGVIDVAHAVNERGFCYLVSQKFPCPGDTMEGVASILRVFEEGKELGPPHSMHEDVRTKGRGAFSHWYDSLYFSASDNSDPRANGRKYTYLLSVREDDIINGVETTTRDGYVQLRMNFIAETMMPVPVVTHLHVTDAAGKALLAGIEQPVTRGEWVKVLPMARIPKTGLRLGIDIPMKVGEPLKVSREIFPPRSLPLEVCSKDWSASTKGKWKDRPDSRLLRGMLHPWEVSETAGFAEITRTVKVPADWVGPVVLQFHVSDSYVGVGYRKDQGPHYVGSDIFLGHRFKRVLVNDKVVWEHDASDDLTPTYFSADLSAVDLSTVDRSEGVKPGQTFRLTLRVEDVVSSKEELPGDDHYGWTWDPKEFDKQETANRSPEIDEKFETNVYWGDVGLVNQPDTATDTNVFAPKSSDLKIPPWHPPHKLTTAREVKLALEAPGGIPAGGFPVTCGVPFASGELTDEQAVQLLCSRGVAPRSHMKERGSNPPNLLSLRGATPREQEKEVNLQTKTLAKWPDGSIKWLLCDFVANDTQPYTLRFGPGVKRSPFDSSLRVVEKNGKVELHTGSFDVEIGDDDRLMNDITASISESGQGYRFHREATEILERGPIRASVRLSGHTTCDSGTLGRFTARIEACSGMPFVRLYLRIFNDAGRTLKVSDFSIHVPATGIAAGNFGGTTASVASPASLHQVAWKQFEVRDASGKIVSSGEQVPGWATGDFGGKNTASPLVAVRHFREQFPKALDLTSKGFTVHLFAPTRDEPFYEPTMGEAKGHELLIGNLPVGVSPKEIADAYQNPPRLFNREYFCATGGLGDVAIHDGRHFPAFDEAAKALEGELNFDGRGKGIRHFPDTYSGATTGAFIDSWINFYHDTFHGMCLEYFMTGDRRWLDLAQAASRHYMDIDIIHHWPPNPNLIGLPHGTGSNHTGHDPYSLIAHLNGLVDVYFLTGDPDAWEAAQELGEAIMRNRYGFGGSSRDNGWPMQGIGRLYRETRDAKYLDYLHQLVKAASGFTMLRRGTYHEMHSTLSYRGQVPFMNAILGRGLMFVVQDTGDKDAAFLLVQVAKSLSLESQQDPGWFNYSPSPHQRGRITNYNFLLTPVFLYAYELTGDRGLLNTGIATFEQGVEQKSFWLGAYFNAGEMLYLLNKLAPGRFAVAVELDSRLVRDLKGWQVTLDGSRSSSSAGKVVSWVWDLGGTRASGQKVTRALSKSGVLKVKLTARDEDGNESSTTRDLALPTSPSDFGLGKWGTILRTEGETFTNQGGGNVVVRDDKLAASGKSFSHWNGIGHWIEWQVDIPEEGVYYLVVRYATPEKSSRLISLDGEPQAILRCPASGGYGSATADNWSYAILKAEEDKPVALHLSKGVHKVRLENQEGTGLNVDYLEWVGKTP